MTYEMLGSSPMPTALRSGCGEFDITSNAALSTTFANNGAYATGSSNYGSTFANGAFPYKHTMSFAPSRPQISIADQAELEFELRYRGNMIVDQQRKIQQLEEELQRVRDKMDVMNSQLTSYEQERSKERKKPQSRYWTPDEHQRFLEALDKFGSKDVKAISMHVSTRNATQVRTHAQKYFLRLERERRKRGDDDGSRSGELDDNSSGDEYSDQSLSPMEELSPAQGISTPPQTLIQSVPQQSAIVRRRRSGSLITPAMGKLAVQYKDAVLAELPSFSSDDFDMFVKGLLSVADKQEDIPQACRMIREGYLLTQTPQDVESCYRILFKFLKQKPTSAAPSSASLLATGSPKRRKTSKPDPVDPSILLAAQAQASSNNTNNSSSSNGNNGSSVPANNMGGMITPSFMSTLSTATGLPPPYMSNAPSNFPFHQVGMMRPMLDYSSMVPPPLSLTSMGGGMMMDVSPASGNPSQGWNPLALYELHQGTQLVSSHN